MLAEDGGPSLTPPDQDRHMAVILQAESVQMVTRLKYSTFDELYGRGGPIALSTAKKLA